MAHRFALTMRVPDSDEPGIVMHDDGTIWWVKQDGSEVQLGSAARQRRRWDPARGSGQRPLAFWCAR